MPFGGETITLGTPSGDSGFSTRQDLIASPETMATVAHAIVRDKYGDEAYWWDPLTVALELKADFETDPCPEFSSGEPMFGAFDPVTVEEAAWAVAEAGMNRDMLDFSPTIKSYCRVILEQDGYGEGSYPPIFGLVFNDGTKLRDVKAGLVSDENGRALKGYLMDNVNDIAKQLDSIPDLKGLDNDILRKGLVTAMSDRRPNGSQG